MLRSTVALAALLAGCLLSDEADDVVEFDCTFLSTEVLELATNTDLEDTELEFQLATCQADRYQCLTFCRMAVERETELFHQLVSSCEVTFTGDKATIEFEYTTYKDRCDSDDDVIVHPA